MKISQKSKWLFIVSAVLFMILLLFVLFNRRLDEEQVKNPINLNVSTIFEQLNLDTLKDATILALITEEDNSTIIVADDPRESTFYVLKAQCPLINDCKLIWFDDIGYNENEQKWINWGFGNGNIPSGGLVVGLIQDEIDRVRLIGIPEQTSLTYHPLEGSHLKLFYGVFQESIDPPVNIQGLSKSGKILFED
ncbi:hypothetical protein [Paenibacillus sp. PL2-23]|uniref:hypothetical protein n=1 Tax=Paenibacillus sp. PL2-23 TaxID=2100729 RepID=UPI0030F5DB0E